MEQERISSTPYFFDLVTKTFKPVRRQKNSERFVRGPIPLEWLHAAAILPGRALHVGIALWFIAGKIGFIAGKDCRRKPLTVSNEILKPFGVDKFAKRRALVQLEGAGLITITQTGNQAPRVTLLRAKRRASVAAVDAKAQGKLN